MTTKYMDKPFKEYPTGCFFYHTRLDYTFGLLDERCDRILRVGKRFGPVTSAYKPEKVYPSLEVLGYVPSKFFK